MRRITRREAVDGAEPPTPTYAEWIARFDTPDADTRQAVETELAALPDPAPISLVMPVFDPPEDLLRAALDSVCAQWYGRWQLCAVDDGSTRPWVQRVLEEYACRDGRITVITHRQNRHISAATNAGVAAATGRYVGVVDHDDLLAPHALALVALAVATKPDAGLVYTDDDHLDEDGSRRDPYCKPDFDPVLLLGQNYVAHLCVVRRDLVDAVGGYREGYEGSQDWDMVLRVMERLRPEQVVHIPRVLYHWRAHPGSTASDTSVKGYAIDAGRRAVADHLRRLGVAASARTTEPTGFTRIVWGEIGATPNPTVSVVMAAMSGESLRRAVDSVLARTTYPAVGLTVVVPADDPRSVDEFLEQRTEQLTVLAAEAAGDSVAARRAALFVVGAAATASDVVCFVHDDIEVHTDRWIEELVGVLGLPGVGAVGAKLSTSDGAVQHFGYRMGPQGEVYEPMVGRDRLDAGYFGRALLVGSVMAASSAGLAVRREAYVAAGGHRAAGATTDAAVDVDLCRRIGGAGWRCALTPYAELVHHGCAPLASGAGVASGWHGEDPTWNPNLVAGGNGEMAWPPRVARVVHV
jgi:glycosyltransferase involved in cell wall biosynthesis